MIHAPARFDAVGLTGELREAEMRARSRGGRWSGWVEAANGDPAWFGGARELQIRTRGWEPTGTLTYVSVSGASAPAARRAPSRPKVVPRREWGANRERGGCLPRADPEYGQVRAAVVHHTVSAVDYSEAEAPGMVLAICQFHRNSQGWNDIGYNALVDRFGNIYEGRAGGLGRTVIGAHAQGFNGQTTGVAALGTHTKISVTKPGLRALTRLLAWKLPRHGHRADDTARLQSAGGSASRYPAGRRITTKRIIGHRRVGLTECPGTALRRQIDGLIRRVQRRIDRNGGTDAGDSGGLGG